MNYPVINSAAHPVGTRMLVSRNTVYTIPQEITILEWSPSGRYYRTQTGRWHSAHDYVIEILGSVDAS